VFLITANFVAKVKAGFAQLADAFRAPAFAPVAL
jgi:hypothetical protein